jgi:hypothetical protein
MFYDISFSPLREWQVPQGLTHLDVKITQNEGHYDACRNCGKNVHKELSHGFILLPENSPQEPYTA